MGLFGGIADIAAQISKTTPFSFDGLTKALKYNADDVAKSYARQQNAKTLRGIKEMRNTLSGLEAGTEQYSKLANDIAKAESNYRSIASAYKSRKAENINAAFKEITGKNEIGVLASAQGYFGNSKYGGTRIKAAVGAGAAVGLGGRYLSGGNLTTNAQGERDIVGIPFV